MKRKVLKKLFPFLMVLTLAGTTVFAGDQVPVQSAEEVHVDVSEESGGEIPEESGAVESESQEESEADEIEVIPDDSGAGESTEEPEESGADGLREAADGSKADGSEEAPNENGANDSEKAPDRSRTNGSGETPDEGFERDAFEEDPDVGTDTEAGVDSDIGGDISFDKGGEEVNARAEKPELSSGAEAVQADETFTSTEGFQFYITWSGNAGISGYTESVTSLVIPSKVTYEGTTYNVEEIGDAAFKENKTITSVQIADGPICIGEDAFHLCTNLQSVSFPRTLKEIKAGAFATAAGSLKELVFPEGLEKIGEGAFKGHPLSGGVTFPSTLKQIGDWAFSATQCTTLFLPSGLESIGDNAFSNNPELKVVIIPDSVKTIGWRAFSLCKNLYNVSLGNGIQEIGAFAFWTTTSLKSIYIPKSVVSIGDSAFLGSGLTTVYCETGSVADNAGYYPGNVEIVHGKIKVTAPAISEIAYIGGKDIKLASATEDAIIYYSAASSDITTNNDGR